MGTGQDAKKGLEKISPAEPEAEVMVAMYHKDLQDEAQRAPILMVCNTMPCLSNTHSLEHG